MYKFQPFEDEPHCLECGEPLYGRSDKKFCNSGCRNAWHGHLRSEMRITRTNTLNGLSRNYNVLDQLLKLHQSSCPRDRLCDLGFRPELVTHRIEKKGKHLEYRCFDIAYNLSSAKIYNIRRV